jgi:hypothetical protein
MTWPKRRSTRRHRASTGSRFPQLQPNGHGALVAEPAHAGDTGARTNWQRSPRTHTVTAQLTTHWKSRAPRSPAPAYRTGCTLCFSPPPLAALKPREEDGDNRYRAANTSSFQRKSMRFLCAQLVPPSQQQHLLKSPCVRYMRFVSNHGHVLAALCISEIWTLL